MHKRQCSGWGAGMVMEWHMSPHPDPVALDVAPNHVTVEMVYAIALESTMFGTQGTYNL